MHESECETYDIEVPTRQATVDDRRYLERMDKLYCFTKRTVDVQL